jgi:hypothetical protein
MTVTITQNEDVPDSYPDQGSPGILSVAASALDPDMIWQRIESYVSHRWTPRAVVWTVEGPGEWHPPLSPTTISTVQIWSDGAWQETFDLCASPYGGFFLPGCGPYRFVAEVGGGSPSPELPAVVMEAFRRLAEYMAAPVGEAGARREQTSIGEISQAVSRDEAWMARAMQNSGAADLLRNFRRA